MILTVVIANSRLKKREVDQMKTLVAGKTTTSKTDTASLIKGDEQEKRDVFARYVLGKDLTERLRDYIEQAGMDWDPARTSIYRCCSPYSDSMCSGMWSRAGR